MGGKVNGLYWIVVTSSSALREALQALHAVALWTRCSRKLAHKPAVAYVHKCEKRVMQATVS